MIVMFSLITSVISDVEKNRQNFVYNSVPVLVTMPLSHNNQGHYINISYQVEMIVMFSLVLIFDVDH